MTDAAPKVAVVAALDIETIPGTDADGNPVNEPYRIGALIFRYSDGGWRHGDEVFDEYVKVGHPALIRDEGHRSRAADGGEVRAVVAGLAAFTRDTSLICTYNGADHDLPALERHGFPRPQAHLDVLRLAVILTGGLPRDLGALALDLGLGEHRSHDPVEDCRATFEVALQLGSQYLEKPVGALQAALTRDADSEVHRLRDILPPCPSPEAPGPSIDRLRSRIATTHAARARRNDVCLMPNSSDPLVAALPEGYDPHEQQRAALQLIGEDSSCDTRADLVDAPTGSGKTAIALGAAYDTVVGGQRALIATPTHGLLRQLARAIDAGAEGWRYAPHVGLAVGRRNRLNLRALVAAVDGLPTGTTDGDALLDGRRVELTLFLVKRWSRARRQGATLTERLDSRNLQIDCLPAALLAGLEEQEVESLLSTFSQAEGDDYCPHHALGPLTSTLEEDLQHYPLLLSNHHVLANEPDLRHFDGHVIIDEGHAFASTLLDAATFTFSLPSRRNVEVGLIGAEEASERLAEGKCTCAAQPCNHSRARQLLESGVALAGYGFRPRHGGGAANRSLQATLVVGPVATNMRECYPNVKHFTVMSGTLATPELDDPFSYERVRLGLDPKTTAIRAQRLDPPPSHSPSERLVICCPTDLTPPAEQIDDDSQHLQQVAEVVAALSRGLASAEGRCGLLALMSSHAGVSVVTNRIAGMIAGDQAAGPLHRQAPLGVGQVTRLLDEHGGVAVGTRGMMTGVDIGRPDAIRAVVIGQEAAPVTMGDPLSNRRSEALAEKLGLEGGALGRSRIRAIEVGRLLRQAIGRVVRSADHGGVVFILDPRLSGRGGLGQHRRTITGLSEDDLHGASLVIAPLDDCLAMAEDHLRKIEVLVGNGSMERERMAWNDPRLLARVLNPRHEGL